MVVDLNRIISIIDNDINAFSNLPPKKREEEIKLLIEQARKYLSEGQFRSIEGRILEIKNTMPAPEVIQKLNGIREALLKDQTLIVEEEPDLLPKTVKSTMVQAKEVVEGRYIPNDEKKKWAASFIEIQKDKRPAAEMEEFIFLCFHHGVLDEKELKEFFNDKRYQKIPFNEMLAIFARGLKTGPKSRKVKDFIVKEILTRDIDLSNIDKGKMEALFKETSHDLVMHGPNFGIARLSCLVELIKGKDLYEKFWVKLTPQQINEILGYAAQFGLNKRSEENLVAAIQLYPRLSEIAPGLVKLLSDIDFGKIWIKLTPQQIYETFGSFAQFGLDKKSEQSLLTGIKSHPRLPEIIPQLVKLSKITSKFDILLYVKLAPKICGVLVDHFKVAYPDSPEVADFVSTFFPPGKSSLYDFDGDEKAKLIVSMLLQTSNYPDSKKRNHEIAKTLIRTHYNSLTLFEKVIGEFDTATSQLDPKKRNEAKIQLLTFLSNHATSAQSDEFVKKALAAAEADQKIYETLVNYFKGAYPGSAKVSDLIDTFFLPDKDRFDDFNEDEKAQLITSMLLQTSNYPDSKKRNHEIAKTLIINTYNCLTLFEKVISEFDAVTSQLDPKKKRDAKIQLLTFLSEHAPTTKSDEFVRKALAAVEADQKAA